MKSRQETAESIIASVTDYYTFDNYADRLDVVVQVLRRRDVELMEKCINIAEYNEDGRTRRDIRALKGKLK